MKPKHTGWQHWYWVNIDRAPGFLHDLIAFVVPVGTEPTAEIDRWMRDHGVDPSPYQPYVFAEGLGEATDVWRRLRRERKATAGGSE